MQCPFTHKDETIKEAVASDKNFCLEKNQAGSEPEYKLKCTHPYYYQVCFNSIFSEHYGVSVSKFLIIIFLNIIIIIFMHVMIMVSLLKPIENKF